MNRMELNELDAFLRMTREFPLRTAIFSFGLPVFATLQIAIGLVSGGSLPIIALFAAVLVAYSVVVTRYHVAVYRRQRLYRELTEETS